MAGWGATPWGLGWGAGAGFGASAPAMTPFDRDLGVQQGRIAQPAYQAAGEPGSGFILTLGHEQQKLQHRFNIGDHVEFLQTADLTANNIIRLSVVVRPPAEVLPIGYAWEFKLRVGGAVRHTVRLEAGRIRVLQDIAANVAALVGNQEIALRLELVAA